MSVPMPNADSVDCLDAEAAVLSAILQDPNAIDRLAGLTSSDFVNADHRALFEALVHLRQTGSPLDPITIVHALRGTALASGRPWGDVVGYLIDFAPNAHGVQAHAKIVSEQARMRRAAEGAAEIRHAALRGNSSSVAIAKQLRELASELEQGHGGAIGTFRTLGEWRMNPDEWATPLPLVPELLYPGLVTLLSAREKMGKTSFAAQMVAALSTGGWFLGQQVPKSSVVWYALDEPLGVALARFDRLKADDGLIITAERPDSVSDFGRAVMRLRPAVIVIDSLGDLWEGSVDSNSHDETRAYLKPYIRVARDVDAAMLLTYHTNAAATKYAGAVSIGAVVDAPLLLRARAPTAAEDGEDLPDDGRRLLEGRTRYGVVRIPLGFAGGVYHRGSDPMPLEDRVLTALAQEPASQNALRGLLGVRAERLVEVVHGHLAGGLVQRDGKQLAITPLGLERLAGNGGKAGGNDGKKLGNDVAELPFPVPMTRPDSGKGSAAGVHE